jgi:cytoplasmic iron level regulating protein YaaA (DUF328/UPF0246 family)
VLLLLPPSEGKATPGRGRPVDLESLAFPELAPVRRVVLESLLELCDGPVERACAVLGLGPTQVADIARNRALASAPTLPAGRLYSGVLYDALDLASLSPEARRRAARSVLVASGLWGMVRLGDRIPAYRLAGGVNMPGLGPLSRYWRPALAGVLPAAAAGKLVLDLRSGTYAAAWHPPAPLADRTVTVTVRHGGKVVSHHNKAAKGRIARAVLCAPVSPRTPVALADLVADSGFCVALTRRAHGWVLVVDDRPVES